METRGLKPHPWATKAGIRSGTLYNYLLVAWTSGALVDVEVTAAHAVLSIAQVL